MEGKPINPYEIMWKELEKRVQSGKTAWGKLELQATLKEIEIAVWRKTDYTQNKEEEPTQCRS